ncbi:PHP domain-containing protein [Thermotalea metallivorans]|uniref:DNA polymerase/3'-5' exonuclease PolX n=1 Tax=Thermotalea metallivorans TaxID=520762 RepID=A0A140L267_9FIRM|nr:PHP domain-containing protein [Thermotalea metallivorans]KXG74642.1 DNA polymerase/3'-5' exonuclease PolX [Thermotalea metallivorans]
MKIFADYHTHTKYSHGKGTIQENVDEALRKGLREVAITDHGPNHIAYGVRKKDIKKMREEIDRINGSTDKIKVKLGLEANIVSTDGKIDIDQEIIKNLDIVLAGYHFGAMPQGISEALKIHGSNVLAKYLPSVEKKVRVINTKAVVEAIYNNPIDIITHPGAKANIDTAELAQAAVKRDTALEINSSHGYLTVEYIKIAMKEGVKFVINSDAHRPADVGNVKAGIDRAVAAGLKVEQILNGEA